MPKARHPRASDGSHAVLKPDLEAAGEYRLAALEIASLMQSEPAKVTGDKRVRLNGLPLEDARFLSQRLAFVDSIIVNGDSINLVEVKIPCVQASLERAAHGHLVDLQNGGVASGANRRRNEYLTHAFHKYKAKFFPRMARALINIVCGRKGGLVLDPFIGSGTTLIEAAGMGVSAVGVDIDPLSVFIANQKMAALARSLEDPGLSDRLMHLVPSASFDKQQGLFDEGAERRYRLPRYIRDKLTSDEARTIEKETAAVRGLVEAQEDSVVKNLGLLALSHSIATKISLRWMGTGDNRFSLSIAKASITSIFRRQLAAMAKALQAHDAKADMKLAPAAAIQGSALALPFADATFDGIVTSPPYLPASSGRETYLRSRGPSLVALDLLTEAGLLEREERMMGSVLNQTKALNKLPEEVVDLVEWMRPQRARAPKAEATATYFGQLHGALSEMARVLKPGGKVALVLAAAHTFYDLLSRETVRVLHMPPAVVELLNDGARPIPLRHIETVEMQLAKMDFKARPGARGDYSEAIMLFERV